MADPGTPEHGIQAAPHAVGTSGQPHFSAAEWEAFQQEDVHAGTAVVGLMISIFSLGLLLYIGVCLSIM